MAGTVKYVRLQGYVQLGVADDGRLTLIMCDKEGKPYAGTEPIFFSWIPGANGKTAEQPDPAANGKANSPVRFLNMDMYAEFNEADFNRYKPLWNIVQPSLTWQNALVPNPITMPHMNPTGPPKP